MPTILRRRLPQPLTGILTAATALLLLGGIVLAVPSLTTDLASLGPMIRAVILAIGLVLTYRFPIHIRHNVKVQMTGVVILLAVALLPVVTAVVTVAVGVATGELMVRRERDLFFSDIASQVGRLMVVALLGSLIVQVPLPHPLDPRLVLVAAALVLWAGDILTSPLMLCPMTGEPVLSTIRMVAREAGPPEGAQYLVALLGAVAARQDIWALALLALPTALVYVTFKHAKELHDSTRQILERMADTVDLRDPYTGGHSRRVTEYSRDIMRELGMHGPEVELIIAAARVHDIGKIAIPDGILNKPGPLTDEERAIMETHSALGADLLKRYPDFARGVGIVRHHHERWDGAGYPDGIKGLDIPLGARIIAVADTYDAMTSDRPYRTAMSQERAVAILRAGRGSQWDAPIVDAFLRSLADQAEQPAPVPIPMAHPATPPRHPVSVA